MALMSAPAAAQASGQGAEDDAASSGEIVVTARKRAETLLDVPLAVTAVTEEAIDRLNIQNVDDLYSRVPGLYKAPGSLNNTSDFAALTIRGVGFNAGLEPAVGVFIAFMAGNAIDNLDAKLHPGYYYFIAYCLVSNLAFQFLHVPPPDRATVVTPVL